jgi:hypothetical protein
VATKQDWLEVLKKDCLLESVTDDSLQQAVPNCLNLRSKHYYLNHSTILLTINL